MTQRMFCPRKEARFGTGNGLKSGRRAAHSAIFWKVFEKKNPPQHTYLKKTSASFRLLGNCWGTPGPRNLPAGPCRHFSEGLRGALLKVGNGSRKVGANGLPHPRMQFSHNLLTCSHCVLLAQLCQCLLMSAQSYA